MSGGETGGVNDEVKFCAECGQGLNDGVKFCPECGQGVGQEEEAPIEWPPRMPERPRPRIFGAVLGALIVWTILCGLFGTFVYMVASAGTP